MKNTFLKIDQHQAEIDQILHLPPDTTRKLEQPSCRDVAKFEGITVRNIPLTVEDDDIFEFLVHSGLPDNFDQANLKINRGKKNISVMVEGLNSSKVLGLYTAIHFDETKQKFFDRPLYCKRLRTSSPLKTGHNSETSDVAASSS